MYPIGLELKYFNTVVIGHFNNNSSHMVLRRGSSENTSLFDGHFKVSKQRPGPYLAANVRCNQK
jgi:hypothetical protein